MSLTLTNCQSEIHHKSIFVSQKLETLKIIIEIGLHSWIMSTIILVLSIHKMAAALYLIKPYQASSQLTQLSKIRTLLPIYTLQYLYIVLGSGNFHEIVKLV